MEETSMPDKWTDGNNTYEIRGGDVYRNNERVGYVSGNELKIDGNTVSFHPHDGDLYVNNQNVGYRTGDGHYRIRSDRSEWKPTK